jgi:TatD DNase family protein
MAGIYDTHTHLNDEIYKKNGISVAEVVRQAKETGVDTMNVVGTDLVSSRVAVRLATQYQNLYAIVGVHPAEVQEMNKADLEAIAQMTTFKKVVGIGEVGLDYNGDATYKRKQLATFKKQIALALEYNLPLVVHIKDREGKYNAYKDALHLLQKMAAKKVVIHGYQGNLEYAKKFQELGYFISFDGKITYKNKELEKVVKNVSLNQLLLETDSPYHSPVPYKNEINFPSSIKIIAEKVALLKKVDVDEVISATRINAQQLFLSGIYQ